MIVCPRFELADLKVCWSLVCFCQVFSVSNTDNSSTRSSQGENFFWWIGEAEEHHSNNAALHQTDFSWSSGRRYRDFVFRSLNTTLFSVSFSPILPLKPLYPARNPSLPQQSSFKLFPHTVLRPCGFSYKKPRFSGFNRNFIGGT